LKVEIFDPKSEEWQKVCAPVQREMTAEKGGLILVFIVKTLEEAVSLDKFAYKANKLLQNSNSEGLVKCYELYHEYSENCCETYFIAYQIFAEKGQSFPSEYFNIVADLLKLFGDFFISE
jgi:hypothetical protein